MLARNHDAADGRALLAGFEGHLSDNFFCKKVEQVRPGRAIGPENSGVDAVSLNVHPNGTAQDIHMRPNARGGIR